MNKCLKPIALLLLSASLVDVASADELKPITKFVRSFGEKEVVEYEPLVGHDGDCEGVIPFSATATIGRVSLSDVRHIGGESSLRWDYSNGDVMSFTFDGGKSLKSPEYETRGGGAAFLYMWVYNTRAIEEKDLTVKIYDDKGALAFEFPIYVNFEGWRCLMIAYDEMKRNYTETEISRMEFIAPKGEDGTLYFDAISPTISIEKQFVNKDYLTPWRADGTNHWGLQWKWDNIKTPDVPKSISADVKRDLETVYDRVAGDIISAPLQKKWNPAVMGNIQKAYDSYHITISEDGVVNSDVIMLKKQFYNDMATIADNYLIAPKGSKERETLKSLYINMAKAMVDQGFAKGHGMGYYLHYGYGCVSIAPSMVKMKDELKECGLYKPMEEALIWLYGLNRIFDEKDKLKKGNADDFYTLYRTYLILVQVIDDLNKRSVYMQTLSDYFNYAIDWRNDSALKENGAHYHHGVHYADYASRALGALGEIGAKLRGTRYRFSEGAHETLRNCALAGLHSSYPYRDNSLYAIGMVSRAREENPTSGYSAYLYSNLALMGTPDGKLEIDPVMASIFKYNFPKASPRDLGKDIKPIDLDGTWTLPHARNMLHRRDNWSAMVTSMSNNGHRNIEAQGWKSHNGPNLSGLMQAFGRFEIYYHEQPIIDNGFTKYGYNWSHRGGITTPDIPANENRMGYISYGNIDANYANGAIVEGVGGAYGTILDNSPSSGRAMFPGVFGVKKSWFFFDDIIVSMGSNIDYEYRDMDSFMTKIGDIKEYPVVTTLFQMNIASKDQPGTHNGVKLKDGVEKIKSNGRDYFIDPIGTGYIVYGGGNLEIMNQRQSCFLPEDTVMKAEESGDFATVLINHGKEPKGGEYEFCIVPGASESQLKKMSKRRGYSVIQRDGTAHVVEYNGVKYYVIFDRYEGSKGDLLKCVERGAIVIVDDSDSNSVTLRVAAPGYNIAEPTLLTLNGEWRVKSGKVDAVECQGGETTLTVGTNDGMTTTITLEK